MLAQGIYAAVVTPVDDQGNIDTNAYCSHARWLLANGCHGLGVFGTTSETNSFSVQERQSALDAYISSGLDPKTMIVGVGCCARADTVALARHALDRGVCRLLALPPFFYKGNSDEGVYRAFAEVIENVSDSRLKLYLYHFPQVSGVPITTGIITKLLASYPETVCGLKDSSGDWTHTKDLIDRFPQFQVFSGADNHLLDNLNAGGAGTISAAANLNCRASRIVFDEFLEGNKRAAKEAMAAVTHVRSVLTGFPLIPAIKHAMCANGRGDVWQGLRPPLEKLDDDRGRKLMAALAAGKFTMSSVAA